MYKNDFNFVTKKIISKKLVTFDMDQAPGQDLEG
jgi:hypothetical protein